IAPSTGTALKAAASSFSSTPVQAGAISLWPATGTFVSSVFNAGSQVQWGSATWNAAAPAGTTLTIQVRGSADGTNWSNWQTLSSSGASIGLTDRYLQYQVIMTTSSGAATPVLSDIALKWG